MEYFDKDFWKMTAGFILIVAIGLLGTYFINLYDKRHGGATTQYDYLDANTGPSDTE
ncbi:MAG: hypothetical protein WCO03_01705 [bacterium]